MRDPMNWSFPLGRMFGVTVRVHIVLPLVALALILRATSRDGVALGEASLVMLILFVSVLLHEFGHCIAAWQMNGDASEIVLWPLGGLAYCDLPPSPKAHLVCAAGGPAVNLLLCLFAGGALAMTHLVPPINPFDSPYQPHLHHWRDGSVRGPAAARAALDAESALDPIEGRTMVATRAAAPPALAAWQTIAAQVFWVNWVLFLFNLLPGYPLDGGQMLQAILWWHSGEQRSALATACYAGFVVMLLIGVYAIVVESVLGLALALYIYVNCRQQLILAESGGDETSFGYDFSQGYTSLEGAPAQAPPKRKRLNFIQRWLRNRAARRARREIERRESEDRRMDELLDKVQRHGLGALTEEERRFMTRVSAR